jgi:hypothetical protein
MSLQSLDDLISERLAEQASRPALLPPTNPIRSTRKAAQWSAAVHRAYAYMTGRLRDPSQQAELDRYYEQTLEEGPDFLKVRREADFSPVPVVTFSKEAAAEIMRQAREIERETYASRAKGKHGGGLGRMAIQLLEWFCFGMWPRAPYGMFPSLAHIAAGSRMSKETVTEAMKTLQLFGFLTVQPRRKRIDTPLGVKVVQDTNGYVLGLAKGLGSLALAVFARKRQPSESTKPSAKETHFYPQKGQRRFFGNLVQQTEVFSSA